MATRRLKKSNQKYSLKGKLLTYLLALGLILPVLHATAKIPDAYPVSQPTDVVAAASYRNELQDKAHEKVIVTIAEPKTSEVQKIQEPEIVPADSEGDAIWDELADCESGGNWSINTGNGYYGGLQFSQGSWNAVGGSGLPSSVPREEQILRGKLLQARGGWGNWPACARSLGLI